MTEELTRKLAAIRAEREARETLLEYANGSVRNVAVYNELAQASRAADEHLRSLS